MHYGIGGNHHCSVQTDLSLLHHPDVASSTCVTVSSGVQTDFPQQRGEQLSSDYSIEFLSCMFTRVCEEELGLKIPKDFLVLASSAMLHLSKKNRSNILYNLAKGIGTIREDGLDSRFPTQRMPMGMVEYTANFFVADDLNQVLPNYSVLISLFIINFLPRFQFVLKIIVSGNRQCTASLVRNG